MLDLSELLSEFRGGREWAVQSLGRGVIRCYASRREALEAARWQDRDLDPVRVMLVSIAIGELLFGESLYENPRLTENGAGMLAGMQAQYAREVLDIAIAAAAEAVAWAAEAAPFPSGLS